jgi:hypothetical protein
MIGILRSGARQRRLSAKPKTTSVAGKKSARHHVYVIELDRKALKHPKFRAANPHHDPSKPPLYVGMTGLDPEMRFERHKYGVKDNSYVRRYGVRLRPDLYAGLNPLPFKEAERMEWVLARELRNEGWAVWQK